MDHDTRHLDAPPSVHCPKCGGAQVWGYTGKQGTSMGAMTIKRDLASRFLGRVVTVECRALVCVACGFTELYSQEPHTLLGDK